jgi:hypothetical protein
VGNGESGGERRDSKLGGFTKVFEDLRGGTKVAGKNNKD